MLLTAAFPGYENLSMAWQALCHQAGTWQDLLEVKGLSKSFTKIQQFLRLDKHSQGKIVLVRKELDGIFYGDLIFYETF